MKEHILQPVDLVFLVLLVNGPFLVVISVKNVLKLMDVMLALRLPPVKLALLGMKAMITEGVIHVMLDFSLRLMVTLALSALAENFLIQYQVLVHLVLAIVKLALQLLNVAVATLDMAILLDIVILALVELIQQAEPIFVKHVLLVCGLTQQMIIVNTVLKLMDVILVIQRPLVVFVLLDMKVMKMEDVLPAMKEHTLQPVVLVLLVLMANGQILQVLVVQIVLM